MYNLKLIKEDNSLLQAAILFFMHLFLFSGIPEIFERLWKKSGIFSRQCLNLLLNPVLTDGAQAASLAGVNKFI